MLTITSLRKSIGGMLLMAALASGFLSCKKDKDNTPDPGTDPNPTVQRIREFRTGEDFVRFDYNTNGVVSKVTINNVLNTGGIATVFNVNYEGGRISSLVATGEKIEAVYENNVLKRADLFEADQRIGYTNYEFQNGLLKRATLYFGEEDDFQPVLEFNYAHNASGNITEMVTMMAGEVPGQLDRAGHVTYQYDDKSNPLFTHRDLMALFWQSASKNNIRQEDHFDADLQPENKFVYTYEYNAKGLPKGAVVTEGLPGQDPATSNLSFIYQ